jgi:hypothetical protein
MCPPLVRRQALLELKDFPEPELGDLPLLPPLELHLPLSLVLVTFDE